MVQIQFDSHVRMRKSLYIFFFLNDQLSKEKPSYPEKQLFGF